LSTNTQYFLLLAPKTEDTTLTELTIIELDGGAYMILFLQGLYQPFGIFIASETVIAKDDETEEGGDNLAPSSIQSQL
jgi:hypothetical protein